MDCKCKFVRKRDGRIVPFKIDNITKAIFGAANSVGGHDDVQSKDLARKVVDKLCAKYPSEFDIPSVDDISDITEYVLIKAGHVRTSKAYIIYR